MSEYPKIDRQNYQKLVFPIGNHPIRQYQKDIIEQAIFLNTLVCLPTGLGKTFIASVIMFNFYNWFPNGLNI